MASYRLGSTGPEVVTIQEQLRQRGLYLGPIDGRFGGGTESAVLAFQRSRALTPDGVVGAETWRALLASDGPDSPAIAREPLAYRCLALTAAFETSLPPPACFAALAGDFDGQGLSFGALQFSLGPGRLAELVRLMDARDPSLIDEVFHRHAQVFRAAVRAPRAARLAWARSIQHPVTHVLYEPWRGMFKALGRRRECHEAQVAAAQDSYLRALALCREFQLWSERAVALMFDIVVQNGSISALVKAQVRADIASLGPGDRTALEQSKLLIVARRRAAVVKPEWVENVRTRKTTIARGSGMVHGGAYDLSEDYGIRLIEAEELVALVS